MRPIAVFGVAVFLTACTEPKIIQLDDIRDARGDTPGIPSEIDCDPAPKHVFDKQGEIIDTVYPILHPSCEEKADGGAGLAALFRPGPGRSGATVPATESDDSDNNDSAAAVDVPTTDTKRPQAGAAPSGPTTEPTPTPAPDPRPGPKAPEERIPRVSIGQGS